MFSLLVQCDIRSVRSRSVSLFLLVAHRYRQGGAEEPLGSKLFLKLNLSQADYTPLITQNIDLGYADYHAPEMPEACRAMTNKTRQGLGAFDKGIDVSATLFVQV
jgi:hypothetical protein